MKTKGVNKDLITDDATKSEALDPFASLADPTPAEMTPTAKDPIKVKQPVRRSASRTIKARASDAFDQPVSEMTVEPKPAADNASSPVKKSAKASRSKLKEKSAKPLRTKTPVKKKAAPAPKTDVRKAKPAVTISPVFRELSEPVLPELEHENRARLLMQSPTRLYFYWSVKENPYQLLRDAFGSDTGGYTLVLKLIELRRDTEVLVPADMDGQYWFDVEPDGEYQAEVGFYAINRPYFRIIYSNTVETPRRSPSTRVAVDSDWTVSANKFAEVLDVSGFTHDAFDVALIGDDPVAAERATKMAFSSFAGIPGESHARFSAEDMRHAMYAIASGRDLEDIRWKVSPKLFATLQERYRELSPRKAVTALNEYFGADEIDVTEEYLGPEVYGASLINFPRRLKTVRSAARYSPISSGSNRG